MDVYQGIAADKYKNQVPYPDRPTKPTEPKLPLHLITPEQLQAHKDAVAEYEAATGRYKDLMAAYRAGECDAIGLFWDDVAESHGIKSDDPFFQRMTGLAWERGHSSGYGDIYGAFVDLLPLYELYRDKK